MNTQVIYLITDLTISLGTSSAQTLTSPSPLPLVKQESDEKLDSCIKNYVLFTIFFFSVFSEDQKKIEKWAKEVCIVYRNFKEVCIV